MQICNKQFVAVNKSLPYKDGEKTFEFLSRNLWNVCKEHIGDPKLAPFWTWDAIQLSKWNAASRQWERFVDEPCTADGLWKAQVSCGILCIAIRTRSTS